LFFRRTRAAPQRNSVPVMKPGSRFIAEHYLAARLGREENSNPEREGRTERDLGRSSVRPPARPDWPVGHASSVGGASCTETYLSESQVPEKSIRRKRQNPAELRKSLILRELQESFGLKKLPPHWQVWLEQAPERLSGGSPARSIRHTKSSNSQCTGSSAAGDLCGND
jgi:hypothetical protein